AEDRLTTPAPVHPEYDAEGQHLTASLQVLENRIEYIGNYQVTGANAHDIAALHRFLVQLYQSLKSARQQVYFGRLDVTLNGGLDETHYLGRVGLEQDNQIV